MIRVTSRPVSSKRRFGILALATALAGACTSSLPAPITTVPESNDASPSDASAGADAPQETSSPPPSDAGSDGDADAAPVVLKRVSGHVDYQGPIANATVTVLSPTSMSTTSDSSGDFFFYLPLGAKAIIKVEAPNLFPMIRGVVVSDPSRIRNFYLAGPPEQAAAQALGVSFDPAKGIVEVDFRNAAVGGYSAALTAAGGGAVTPGFGIALDGDGAPQLSMCTVAGGSGSTLLFGDVPASTISFAPILPDAGTLPCQPCDAPELPVQAGTVTWFDYECGTATDCQ